MIERVGIDNFFKEDGTCARRIPLTLVKHSNSADVEAELNEK